MATTPKGIYYPNNYNEIADIPEDMKKMAESIDEVFENTDSDLSDIKAEQTTQNNRLNSLEVDNTTNKSDILTNKQEINNIKTEQTTQNNRLNNLETDNTTNKDNISANTQEINNIKQEQTEQNTNISTNATNIESLQEENESLKKIVSQLPQVTGQGTSITLENTIEATFTKFDVEGNSEQETTTGKNKVDVTSGNLYSVPETLTLTQREDGRLFLNGKMNGTTTQLIFNMNFANIENGKTYKIVTKVVSGTWDKSIIGMQFRNSNGQQIQTLQNSSSAQESKVIEGDVAEVRLYFGGTFEATNLVIEIMLVEASVTDDSFEKFTYGASPNPNYEQPIKSAGENGSITEKISNLSNLLDWNKFINFSNWKASNSSGYMSFEISGLTSGKTYTLCRKNNDGYNEGMYAAFNRNNNNSNLFIHSSNKEYNKQSISVDIAGSSSLYIVFSMSNATQLQNYINLIQDCWVIEGDSFKEKEEQDYPIFVQQPMRSIGDVRDCFVKKDGNWFERHYIGRYICKGNEVILNQTELETVSRWVIQMTGAKIGSALSNYYTYYANYTASTEHFYVAGNQILTFHNKTITSGTQYLQYFAEKYKNGNPVYFDYQLAEPLDLPCTPEQIQQLENKPSTYKDFTYVVSEDETPAYLEVSGVYDLNKLITRTEVLESES